MDIVEKFTATAIRHVGRFFKKNYLYIVLILLAPVSMNRVKNSLRSVIWSDAEGYFAYLPAFFDIKNIHEVPPGSMYCPLNEKGETVIKYTCGVALCQLPFYLVGKKASEQFGWGGSSMVDANIYGKVSAWSVSISGYLAGCLGFLFLQSSLRRRGINELAISIALLVILAGTNLFHFIGKR